VTETGTAALEAVGLEVTYPGRGRRAPVRAVDSVNLSVMPGEIVALAGESGCGKSTLARALLGLVPHSAGEVRRGGAALRSDRRSVKAHRREVQLIMQDPTGALNPRHSVYEAVAEGLRIHGIVDDEEGRVHHALGQAGLRPPERFLLRYPGELSGGQRQRVVIAGALVLGPRVLVADEPVSSLDASVRGELLALLLNLRDELGLSVLVITHDLGLAWSVADRLAVMYLGRIVEKGRTEDLLRRAWHPYTQALLSVLPEVDRLEPVVLSGEPPDPTRVPPGCRFHPRCPALAAGYADVATVADACRERALPVLDAGGEHTAACHLVQAVDGAAPVPRQGLPGEPHRR
jgi:oligopeptide/dipeptide ABC transporter ATP-binding protein